MSISPKFVQWIGLFIVLYLGLRMISFGVLRETN